MENQNADMTGGVGVIGLGIIGFGMASNLRKKLEPDVILYVYDVLPAAIQRLIEEFGRYGKIEVASSPADLANKCHTVLTGLPAGKHVEQVYANGDNCILKAEKNTERLIIDCSTIEIELTQDLGKRVVDARLGTFVDATVSGGVWGANGGSLTFMVGHSKPTEVDGVGNRIWNILSLVGQRDKIRFCGGLGMGQVAKIAHNYVSLCNNVTATQGMAFGLKYGIEKKVLWECMTDGTANSWVMGLEQPVPGLVAEAPSSNGYRRAFAASLSLKDLGIAMKSAEKVGLDLTVGKVAIEAFKVVDEDPRTKNLDHTSLWLHVNDNVDAFIKENGLAGPFVRESNQHNKSTSQLMTGLPTRTNIDAHVKSADDDQQETIYICGVTLERRVVATSFRSVRMPLHAENHVPVQNKDVLSWMYDEPQFDHELPEIYIDAYDATNSISAAQAKVMIRQLIAGFRHAGVQKGDTVLVHAFNSIYYPILVLGIIGCGAIYTGSNPAYTAYELGHAFQSCGPKLLVCDRECMNGALSSVARDFGLSPSSVLVLDLPPFKALHTTENLVIEGYLSWRSLLTHGETDWARFNDEVTSRMTVAGLFFSSGTTGLPKLTKLSHYNLVAQHTLAFEHFPRPYVLKRLIALPMFHAATAPSTHISPLRSGHPQVIMRRYDPGTFLEMCARHQITDLTLVPPQVISLLAHPMPVSRKTALLVSVRLAYGGAAPLDAVTQSRFQALLPNGSPFTQVMGMTETSCFASLLPYPENDDTGSVGRFLPNLDVKLLDDSGAELQDYSQPGELAIRGPTVTEGYVGVPKDRDFDSEGYLRTGDILYQDEKTGLWYIVDRKKEMIKVRGFQVAPKELEGVLLEHAGIADAAVIGVKSDDGSELPRAYVVRKQDVALSEADVKRWVEEKLARYKWLVGGVMFTDSIPKSPSGKILKRVLRESIEKQRESKL
ncbi:hypothetical protein OPT61_g222 [Boeremia exigua]|uniref:Uncharacterized protein n=1 Tax=Boeremia exigua TaxID=749465 RepID=A0ACC2IUK2_9PLEO|nr:hypothetical protein OPT61_g222 [Boeremia exigua]